MTPRTATPIALAALVVLGGCSEAARPACGDDATCSRLATLMTVADANLGGYDHSQVATADGRTVDFRLIEFGGSSDCINGCARSDVCVVVTGPTPGSDVLGFSLVDSADARTWFTSECQAGAPVGTSQYCHFSGYDLSIWDDPAITEWIAKSDNGCRALAIEAVAFNSTGP